MTSIGKLVEALIKLHTIFSRQIYERDLRFPYQRFMFLRDERISGSPWKMVVSASLRGKGTKRKHEH